MKKFIRILTTYFSDETVVYPEYRGKPYFEIEYEENGERYIGFGTNNPEIFSGYLRDDFIDSKPEGKWIAREDMDYVDKNKVVHNHFECSKCGLIHDFIDGHTSQYNFCPNCGADMRGGAE